MRLFSQTQKQSTRNRIVTVISAAGLLLVACSLVLCVDDLKAMSTPENNPEMLPCPESPNCVSSTNNDPEHHVPALTFERNVSDKAMLVLEQVFVTMADQVQALENGTALHAEFKSTVFGFIDDVDARLIADQNRIEIRSASRTGYYDFGVNRRRVEKIRKAFNQLIDTIDQ